MKKAPDLCRGLFFKGHCLLVNRPIRVPCNMNKKGPIVVIEDDEDDQEVLVEIFRKLGHENELVFFKDGNAALDFLNQTDLHPFLILSDINMPKINGFELRKKIFEIEA